MEIQPIVKGVNELIQQVCFLGVNGLVMLKPGIICLKEIYSNGTQPPQLFEIRDIHPSFQVSFMILTPGGRYTISSPTLDGDYFKIVFEGDIWIWEGNVYIRPINLEEMFRLGIICSNYVYGPRISKVVILNGNRLYIGTHTSITSRYPDIWIRLGSLIEVLQQAQLFKPEITENHILNEYLGHYVDKMFHFLKRLLI